MSTTFVELAPGIYDPDPDPVEDDAGIYDLAHVVEIEPGIWQTYLLPEQHTPIAPWRVDLCIGWERVAVVTAGKMTATAHKNEAGSFLLETSPAGIPPAGVPIESVQTVTILDEFDRANGPIGSSWTVHSGAYNVLSNKTSSPFAVDSTATWNTPPNSDQFVQVIVYDFADSAGVLARAQDGNNFYMAFHNGGAWKIEKKVGGTFQTLASIAVAAPALPYVLRLEAEGTTLRLYANGVLQLVATDATFTAGKIGLRTPWGGSQHFDDFVGGTYQSPSSEPFDPRDVDTIRLCSGNRVLFPGYVGGADGGFWIKRDADGERWQFTGEDGWWDLRGRIAYPDPTLASGWAVAADTRTGVASSVLAAYLDANMGPTALPNRQVPLFQVADEIVGVSQAFSAMYKETMEDLAQRIAAAGEFVVSPEVAFDGTMTVRLSAPRDLSEVVVFSDKGDLLTSRARFQRREATYTLSGGTGDGVARILRAADTGATGRERREQFSDVSNLEQAAEVQSDAYAKNSLARERYAVTSTLSAAIANVAIAYGLRLGDSLGIGINGRRYALPIEAVTFDWTPERQVMTPQFGDAIPDELARLLRQSRRTRTS